MDDAIIKDGSEVVIVNPASNKAISVNPTNDSKRLNIENISISGTSVCATGKTALLKVKAVIKDNVTKYEFILGSGKDAKYLAGDKDSKLIYTADESDYSLWILEKGKTEGTYFIKNNAAMYKNNAQYLQCSTKFNNVSLYSTADKGTDYEFKFYNKNDVIRAFDVDKNVKCKVTQLGGSASYDVKSGTHTEIKTRKVDSGKTDANGKPIMISEKYEAIIDDFKTVVENNQIKGDLFDTNDMLDKSSLYSAYVNGKSIVPYQRTQGAGGSNYNFYMGANAVGSGTDDYMLITTSSHGYGNMDLAFRMRGSNTAAAKYQLQYSTDGINYSNFSSGTYKYSYTAYVTDGDGKSVQKPVSGEGKITDGICNIAMAKSQYVSFDFDVPSGASNADKLYIKFVPGKERVDGVTATKDGKAAVIAGYTRLDCVVMTGNPVIADDLTGYVKTSTPSGEIQSGAAVELTTATEGAKIFVSKDAGETYSEYNGEKKLVVDTLPSKYLVYATKDGLQKSIIRTLKYTAGQCKAVKIAPNGGGIKKDSEVTLKTDTENATIKYAILDKKDDEVNDEDWKVYTAPIKMDKLPCVIKAIAIKDGMEDSAAKTLSFTERTKDKYSIYFGQVHSHTNYSDGAGTCEEAFQHARNVKNLDFLAVTDHSNSLDNEGESDITRNVDKNITDEWTSGHTLAQKYSDDKFTCFYGYEMTWSNGLGHMNTFNTPGFQSRTQTDYKSYATALNNYYTTLEKVPESISQFNHPGTTFGDFQDFAYYSKERDNLITMIEVGNGEGTVGSSGYFPSYEYYQRALDKGWHVAPTNNQDNHKGRWGDANTARTIVLADENNETNIYDAMRNYRVYASEDNDLSIYYTLDDNVMGTILSKGDTGSTVHLKADISDPDSTDKIGKVQVITNGGIVLDTADVDTNHKTVEFDVDNKYSYYYLKVTEADKDIAVTAPVWVGEVEACGIESVKTNTVLPIAGKSADINVGLYNNENTDLTVNSMTFSIDGKEIKSVTPEELKAAGCDVIGNAKNAAYKINYTPEKAGSVTINVKVNATLNGVDKVYTGKVTLKVTDPNLVTKVVVDGSHYNDYVAGYYANSMGNLKAIAGSKNVEVTVADKITADTLKDCELLVVSAPAKKAGEATGEGNKAISYKPTHFEDEFLALVKDYVAKGGSVIVCGIADYNDTKDAQTSIELNKLLGAIGSTMKINSDEVWDDVNNGGQQYRLYPNKFNMDSEFLKGVKSDAENGQKYSQYSGCSVDITGAKANDTVKDATWLVKGFDTTRGVDSKDDNGNVNPATVDTGAKDKDGKPIMSAKTLVEPGNVVFLAQQDTKAGGHIFAAGGVFVSDFEVKAAMDNANDLPYANKTIVENILNSIEKQIPTSTIAEARKGKVGDIFAVEGYVTSGTVNEKTTFFDTIYLQDDTAGIDIFPYSEKGMEVGTHLRVIGTWDQYQGDTELRVISVKKIDDKVNKYEPIKLSTEDAMNYSKFGGSYVQTTGKVTRVQLADDGKTLSEFWIADKTGKESAIFIDGYIYSGITGQNTLANIVKVGETITASGILYMHPEGNSDASVPVFRVKDCDEIVIGKAADDTPAVDPGKTNPDNTPANVIEVVKHVVDTVVQQINNFVNNIINTAGNIINRLFGRNVTARRNTAVQSATTKTDAPTSKAITITKSDTTVTEDASKEAIPENDTPKAVNEVSNKSDNVMPVFIIIIMIAAAAGAVTIIVVKRMKSHK